MEHAAAVREVESERAIVSAVGKATSAVGDAISVVGDAHADALCPSFSRLRIAIS